MLKRIRNSYITKGMAVLLAFNLLGELIFPSIAFGLTSGPIDINQASFEPAATSEMVNLATGDFTYNIPLMDVDGYPINLAYHGGVSMEQEASMVGLGWTLNVGAMNRMKRGLPDDFNGDPIVTEMNLRPRTSTGGSMGVNAEFAGSEPPGIISPDIGISFNNYTGYSLDLGANVSVLGAGFGSFVNLGLGVGLESSTENGMSISPAANLKMATPGQTSLSSTIGVGFTVNTAQGLQNINVSAGMGLSSNKASMGLSSSTTVPVSTVTYTPTVNFEKDVKIRNFDYDLGMELAMVYPHAKGSFFKSQTCVSEPLQYSKGYGYLYEQNKDKNENYLLDFNRDGVVIPNENIAFLPLTNHTFDVYSASAQGVGFSSRPFRSDVSIVSEATKEDEIGGFGFSGEFGYMYPLSFEIGVNLHFSSGYTKSGIWSANNDIVTVFKPNDSPGYLYEEAYYKKFDNRSATGTAHYNYLQKEHPLRQKIEEGTGNHKGLKDFVSVVDVNESTDAEAVFTNVTFDGTGHYRSQRDLRNTNIQYLTAEEATNFGLEAVKTHELNDFDYTDGDFDISTLTRFGTSSTEVKEHHLSEMTVLKGDGSRYVYGIPVVNHFTDEVVFNVSNKYPADLNTISTAGGTYIATDLTPDCQTGLVEYQVEVGGSEPNKYVDNSTINRRGDNNLYIKKRTPASANSHLLTAYLSSNYIDRTGDGPSPDDFGGYTKFNYSKMDNPTKWRFPFEENNAAYNEGLKANEYDDMGSYVYGEREQWYVHSIESKNFVAVFEYGDRHDGYGVKDENGGRETSFNNAKRLVSISLYTRQGLENGEAAIKTIHFEYDYLLCQDVPNNDDGTITLTESENGVSTNQGGKLTLTGIYFTYGESKRGKLHKYSFEYDSDNNPTYSLGQTDRWGSYLGNTDGDCDPDNPLSNFEFPYATQDRTIADKNAAAWTMKSIHLPSGSKIDIEIEADDYSYVMEKKASKMFMIKGMSFDGTTDGSTVLYDDSDANRFLHVELDEAIMGTESEARDIFIRDYIGDLTEVYFKCLVSVSPKVGDEDKYEYVAGYADIDLEGLKVRDEDLSAGYETGIIPLKTVHIKDEDKTPSGSDRTNPITKATWQFMRKYLPKAINPIVGSIYTGNDGIPYGYDCTSIATVPEVDEDDPSPDAETQEEGNLLRNIFNLGKSQVQNILSLGGYNYMLRSLGFASKFKPQKSWVRLYQGQSGEKIGGGHRVESISVVDNWSDVKPSEGSSDYGTVYSYDLVEVLDAENNRTISSGVASYEPVTAGADENTYRKPTKYTIDVKFRADDNEFQERPLGEDIFGTSQVVYSQVEVKNKTYEGVDENATGKTLYEFYTAKDFPSVVENTNRASNTRVKTKSKVLKGLFTGDSFYNLSMSQGYSVQINDMHGKFKSKTVIASQQGGGPGTSDEPEIIYALEHKYYRDPEQSNKLRNELSCVSESGVVYDRFIGKDIDMVVDLHETRSYHSSTSMQYGVEINPPAVVPSFWLSGPTQDNRFRSSVTTKVVYSNGILEEIVLQDKGRQKITRNLLFDEKTGVPLVTQIIHEAGAGSTPIYQYDYPAYWMYGGMGLASENWGATFENIADTDAKITLAGYQNFFNPGDEIAVYNTTTSTVVGKFWVIEDETTAETTKDYYLIDELGDKLTIAGSSIYSYKILRSGKRNLLGSTAASVTSLHYDEDAYTPAYAHSQILNASAVEYTEKAFGYLATKAGAEGGGGVPFDYTDLCGLAIGQKTNPYVQGLRANWNLLASYVFDGDRDQTVGSIREDGTLSGYVEFWKNTAGKWGVNPDSEVAQKWIKAAIATIFDREGYNLESKDALGIYSAILLGYNKTLKVAEAVNARYYEIGFDGFEDRGFDVAGDCTAPHFRFTTSVGEITNQPKLAHTGRHALKIDAGDTESFSGKITNDISHETTNHVVPYLVQQEEIIPGHHFIVGAAMGKRYVLTTWVKEEKSDPQVTTYDGAQIEFTGFTPDNVVEKRSNIIDGWQRVEIEFTVPGSVITSPLISSILLKNTSETNAVYFDDIRIQPYNSEMVSYVIDPISMRLWATLDSRNFATFYQYDEEGSLVRIIQETERGKVTVQENRAGIRIAN